MRASFDLRVGVVATLAAIAGCGDSSVTTREFEAIVRQRAAAEFVCAADEIVVTDLGGLAFRAEGCDRHATYECSEERVSGRVYGACVRAVRDDPVMDDAGRD